MLFAMVKSLIGILSDNSKSNPEDALLVIEISNSFVSPELTKPNSNFDLS